MAAMQMATLTLTPIGGALASEADAAANFRGALFWACVLAAGFVVMGVAAWVLRRRLLEFRLRRSAGLTVEQVEKLYEDGMISREEFDRARRVVMGLAGVQAPKASAQSALAGLPAPAGSAGDEEAPPGADKAALPAPDKADDAPPAADGVECEDKDEGE